MTADQEREKISARWKEIDQELEALEGRKSDLPDHRFAAERDRLLGEQDELEHRVGELYLEERERA